MDQGGSRHQELDPERSKNEAGTPQAPSLFLWWKIILGILLLGSIALKLAVVLLLFSASQCKDKETAPKLIEKLIDNSCTVIENSVFENVRLDPDTAHHSITISKDLKNGLSENLTKNVTNNSKRFDVNPCALGQEGFTSGRHWWEVKVRRGHTWALGVARESVVWKKNIQLPIECSYWWAIGNDPNPGNGVYLPCYSPSMDQNITTIRVVLNYSHGQVLFFDAHNGNRLQELQAAFLGEKIYPLFCVGPKTEIFLSYNPSGNCVMS